ncbi:MAG TPA: hydroxymethylbilane synthase [Pyrinomonadaceae bacterium]|nr:hydroxymethylbilane synthase [Pyrinomonadaceae bacterium]
MERKFTIGSRGSDLALWQTSFAKNSLESHFPNTSFDVRIIKTKGDAVLDTALSKIGDKGLFTKEIEHALLAKEIDLAVHSLKDLPTTQPEGLRIGSVSKRETPNDIFISKKYSSLKDLPKNAKVATGSLRRKSQLLAFRPDLEIVEIRGNVPTRIERYLESGLDGMILAYAGVHRLGLDAHISQIIPTEILLPAVGQGVMAIEIREDDTEIAEMLEKLNDAETNACITAERAFLRRLEGGCQVPIGANAVLENDEIVLRGFVGSLDGAKVIRDSIKGAKIDAETLGIALAEKCLDAGALEILGKARNAAADATGEVLF